MKNVRIFYKKTALLKFVSHLDMTRFMARALRKTDIPVWYTEGYNSHLYLTFALPLSLGFESTYEVMDIKITDDNYPLDKIKEKLSYVMPSYLQIISVAEPVSKVGDIAFAEYEITFDRNVSKELTEFLKQDKIICQKRNKKKQTVDIDVAEKIAGFTLSDIGDTVLKLCLPAGGGDNLNPSIILDAFKVKSEIEFNFSVIRTKLMDRKMNIFE